MELVDEATKEKAAKLREIEAKWQRAWEEAKVFEANADPSRPKFFVTFPFPYMNGLPHLGSAFTILRVDVVARYKRMRGYNVLFPQGWHATGGPIVAQARRLAEGDRRVAEELKSMGVPEEEIPKFKDPAHWVEHFTAEWERDLRRYGLSIDWRRKFFTTSLNPYFSKFVEWQYLRLRELGYVRKGSHPVVWCPKEKKVVGDHDRPDEYVGIGPVEATIILFRLKGEDLYLPVLTYRPETIFGVTNLWVRPDYTYLVAVLDGKKVVINDYMAEELSDQKHSVEVLGSVSGRELVGKVAVNPMTGEEVPVLPASFVKPDEGTGLVMSVPAHAPYDYMALEDLKKNPATLRDFGLDESVVAGIRPRVIINTEGIRGVPAEQVSKKFGARTQNDEEALEKATKELYSKEYYLGVMNERTGEFSGMKVLEARPLVTAKLRDMGMAMKVYTLPSKVYCRCGARTHVKFVEDQWFLAYSDEGWKRKAREAVEGMEFYPPQAKSAFLELVDWLKDWAFTHQNELGTPLPWDPSWVIESLSDSTIYMAYYTIAHLVQGKVPPESLRPEFFDYVFLGRGTAEEVSKVTGLPIGLIEEARREFEYWYPVDLRISGKDLMQNHLLFFIYHHVAIFDRGKWPRSIGLNGWVLINGEKMSKSKGNFITLRQMLDYVGADATRMAEILAGADAGLDDANFELGVARKAVDELLELLDFVKEWYGKGRDERLSIDDWFESVLNTAVAQVTKDMEALRLKSAFVRVMYELRDLFRWYVRRAGSPNKELAKKYIEYTILMLAPFVPHVAEEAWHLIGKEGFASLARWPEPDEGKIRPDVERAEKEVMNVLNDLKDLLGLVKGAKEAVVTVAARWKFDVVRDIKGLVDSGHELRAAAREVLRRQYAAERGEVAKVVEGVLKMPEVLDVFTTQELELRSLSEAVDFLSRELGIKVIVEAEEGGSSPRRSLALPGRPAIFLIKA